MPLSIPTCQWTLPEPTTNRTPLGDRLAELRGLTPDELDPRSTSLHPPTLMIDLDLAVDRLRAAVESGKKIVVYGDYDVDGVCSTAIAVRGLRHVGADVEWMLPDRQRDGYGIKPAAVDRAHAAHDPKILVAVDNGTTQFDAVLRANELGMDVIILDHHQPRSQLPKAFAVVNPHRADCTYPFKTLTAAAVAFKVVQALCSSMVDDEFERKRFLASLLDLVALGTVADVAPIRDENRIMVRRGLRRLAVDPRPGLLALLQVAGVGRRPITTTTLGFQIAPRLNAAGRLSTPDGALRLLLSDEHGEAMRLASELDKLNRERQAQLESGLSDARDQVASQLGDQSLLVARGELWHLGVVGLLAGRLTEEYGRPTLVATNMRGDGVATASLRSIDGYNIAEAVDMCSDLLVEYGGHPGAAGLSVRDEMFDALRQKMTAHAREKISPDTLAKSLNIDAIVSAGDLSVAVIDDIDKRLAPFGEGNREPVVMLPSATIGAIHTLKDGAHLKLKLTVGGKSFDGLWWRRGDLADQLTAGTSVDVAGCLEVNEFRGEKTPQMVISDLRPA